MRSRQTKPLKLLKEFISKSGDAVKDIEKSIGGHLGDFVDDVPGINIDKWEVEILFPEYNRLREAISNLIDFTLYDKNRRKIDAKGSGIQRVLLLAIIKYIISKYRGSHLILAIDEPEAFLQPSLQKKASKLISEMVSDKCTIIISTHSQYFVNIDSLDNVILCEIEYEKRNLKRRPKEEFYRAKTFSGKYKGIDKVQKIKSQLGIQRNDSWEILPYNLIVEGPEDKDYIIRLSKCFNCIPPNILIAGGATKIKGYLQFLKEFCDDLEFTPKILCLLDHDKEGKQEYQAIDPSKYQSFDLEKRYIGRCDGRNDPNYDYEIEDLLCPKLIIVALNTFLRKQSYKPLSVSKSFINTRFAAAYNGKCILAYLTEQLKAINITKPELPIDDDGIKKMICANVCKILGKEGINNYSSDFPAIRIFIESICQPE